MRGFKLFDDMAFAGKLRGVVGLYVSPPVHAIVRSADEKSQFQALDRTRSGLPLRRGRGATMMHDYINEHNQEPRPCVRRADPDQITAAVTRGHRTLKSILQIDRFASPLLV